MTADELELLRNLKAEVPEPSDEMRRRIYAYATGSATRQRSHGLLRLPPFRLRFALPVAAAICAAVAAVVFTGVLGGAEQPGLLPGPSGINPLDLNITRSDGAITSISVTAYAATLGGTAQIEVVRGQMEGQVPSTTGQVVYQERVPMTNVASPASGPPGTVALSQWSGTLSPAEWDGGCQNAPYWLLIAVSPASNPTTGGTEGEQVQSGSFQCSGS
jgi:hypothetical protein